MTAVERLQAALKGRVPDDVINKIADYKATVRRATNEVSVRLECASLIDISGEKKLEGAVASLFPQASAVTVLVTYPGLAKELETDFARFKKYILGVVKTSFPAVSPFLADCGIAFNAGVISFGFSGAEGADFFNANCCGWLASFVSDKFGISVTARAFAAGKQEEVPETEDAESRLLREAAKIAARKAEKKEPKIKALIGALIHTPPIKIAELTAESGRVTVSGDIMKAECRELKGGKTALATFDMTDYSSSVTVKLFTDSETYREKLKDALVPDAAVTVRGEYRYDKFNREMVIMADDINLLPPKEEEDKSPVKRVELHLHTVMSSMDAVTQIAPLMKRAARLGHKAIAVTDHGIVQAFPEAYTKAKENGIKLIFGMEGYLVSDTVKIDPDMPLVVFDIETTGLDPKYCGITEIGAVRIKNGELDGEFATLINPGMPIPPNITKLTGISDEMVKDAPKLDTVLREFYEFAKGCALVAHNAAFDASFIIEKGRALSLNFTNPIVDTLEMARQALPYMRSHKLNKLAEHFGIDMGSHHRALDDAKTAYAIYKKCAQMLGEGGVWASDAGDMTAKRNQHANHIIILAKNQTGLMNLYKLVTESHLENFYYRPRITKKMLAARRDGLLLGSACHMGELYQAVLNGRSSGELTRIASFYDYLEIQPICNNAFLIREGTVTNEEQLREINRKIVALGERLNIPVVATTDAHFLNKEDGYFRRILLAGQGFDDADYQPDLYYRTTDEMLEEFSYLGPAKAHEVVITNPNRIADGIEQLKPFPDGTFAPRIDGADEKIRQSALARAKAVYGEVLPELVEKRLNRELRSIINNGYAVLYYIAQQLVQKSLGDGYLVGSRGSVGSSFVAWLTGITEVNPLPPHYVCPNCRHSIFEPVEGITCGVDLPEATCPECATRMIKMGYDIPFEVFLGFEGDKVPDIDLNFSGEYQSTAHKFIEELFGEGHVFRAGTISTMAEKTAYGFVMKYLESKGIAAPQAEIDRLSRGCTGIKRTTGQHPGGVIVVPKDRDVHEFTPIQHPADDKTSGIVTTHFDFDSLHDRLVKLDILGHDDPTALRMLQDLTGVDPRSIPLDDPVTMSLFSSADALGIPLHEIGCEVGTLGIPEFGTRFVRQMLVETRPKTMAELIRICGLSHGTDVWINNAQDIIKNGIATLSEVICTRDDIMNALIAKGVDPLLSFKAMESVRKGKGLKPEMEQAMREHGIDQWVIDSCNRIQYMFPKAHAAAYVMMSFRIAYFKAHYPEAFYATYFSVRSDDFDSTIMLADMETLKKLFFELDAKGNGASVKEKAVLTALECIIEMKMRGIDFLNLDLYRSDAKNFLIENGKLRPPLASMPGIGEAAAKSIIEARKEGAFLSIEDLQTRGRATKTVIEALEKCGCLEILPKTSQLSLF